MNIILILNIHVPTENYIDEYIDPYDDTANEEIIVEKKSKKRHLQDNIRSVSSPFASPTLSH